MFVYAVLHIPDIIRVTCAACAAYPLVLDSRGSHFTVVLVSFLQKVWAGYCPSARVCRLEENSCPCSVTWRNSSGVFELCLHEVLTHSQQWVRCACSNVWTQQKTSRQVVKTQAAAGTQGEHMTLSCYIQKSHLKNTSSMQCPDMFTVLLRRENDRFSRPDTQRVSDLQSAVFTFVFLRKNFRTLASTELSPSQGSSRKKKRENVHSLLAVGSQVLDLNLSFR